MLFAHQPHFRRRGIHGARGALSKHPADRLARGGSIPQTPARAMRPCVRRREIGLMPESVTVIGYGDEYFTGTVFRVTPVIAHFEPLPYRIDRSEVAECSRRRLAI